MRAFFLSFLPMYIVFILDALLLLYIPWFGNTVWASSWIMHIIGGVVTGWSMVRMLRILRTEWMWQVSPKSFFAFIAWGCTAIIIIVWEWYEFVLDIIFGSHHQLGLADTMVDMALGLVGSAIFLILWLVRKRREKRS